MLRIIPAIKDYSIHKSKKTGLWYTSPTKIFDIKAVYYCVLLRLQKSTCGWSQFGIPGGVMNGERVKAITYY